MKKIAILGAGISGLMVGRNLSKLHAVGCVDIFEKSRGVGGRMATRRYDTWSFDHGAPFFTARNKTFQRWLLPLIDEQVITAWQPKLITLSPDKKPFKRQWYEPHYVGVGGNNRLAKYLAGGQHIVLNSTIQSCNKIGSHWFLTDNNNNQYGPYDWLITAMPAAQVVALFEACVHGPQLPSFIRETQMTSCFSLMLVYEHALPVNWQWAKVNDSCIASIALEYAKPKAANGFAVVIKSTEVWAEKYKHAELSWVQAHLLHEFNALLAAADSMHALPKLMSQSMPKALHSNCHRWLYSQKCDNHDTEEADDAEISPGFYSDESLGVSCCGDWLLSGGIESAFLSANALSQHLQKTDRLFSLV